MSVSVIVTTRNEEPHIAALLSSLVGQEDLLEVILVDAESRDATIDVAQGFQGKLPLVIRRLPCSRGEGRNVGAAVARGDLLAFIDGDCVATSGWLAALTAAWRGDPQVVVAGRTELEGRFAFRRLHRVELPNKGQDTTWPSCNLAYPRVLFEKLGGFDPAFVTAEDIDLNYRAVDAGARIHHAPDAIVRAQARGSVGAFLTQAFWNGYGRKQLTRKHGRLWREYRLRDLIRPKGPALWGTLRMAAGVVGYLAAKVKG